MANNKKKPFWIMLIILGIIGIFLITTKVLGYEIPIYQLILNFQNRNSSINEPFCDGTGPCLGKPVIYLYPLKKQNISVKIDYKPGIFVSYPDYNFGWNVSAEPNGKLTDKNGKEYSYLFWEGNKDKDIKFDMTTGFVVSNEESKDFLETKLKYLGLEPKEYNDFIVYWLPKLKQNKYNLIHFATAEEYEKSVKLTVSPEPDSVLRVIMVYKPLNTPTQVRPQILPNFTRKGFSVVEWGGIEIN